MTAPEANMKRYELKKQSQFKAKQNQYAGLRPEIRSMKFEILNKKHRSQMTAPEANMKRYELKKQSQL